MVTFPPNYFALRFQPVCIETKQRGGIQSLSHSGENWLNLIKAETLLARNNATFTRIKYCLRHEQSQVLVPKARQVFW